VLTVRFKTFLPIDPVLRETDEFKLFWSEYRSMAIVLGIEKESWLDVVPLAYWSPPAVRGQHHAARLYRLDGKRQGPTDAARWTTWTSFSTDGSMAFSKEHSESFRTDSVVARRHQTCFQRRPSTRITEQRAAKMSKRAAWPVDPKRLEALGVLLAFLKKEGTHVTIAITPFHRRVLERQHGLTLRETASSSMEERVRAIAVNQGPRSSAAWIRIASDARHRI